MEAGHGIWSVLEQGGVVALRDELAKPEPDPSVIIGAMELIASAKTQGNVTPGLGPAMAALGVSRLEQIAQIILRDYPPDFGINAPQS